MWKATTARIVAPLAVPFLLAADLQSLSFLISQMLKLLDISSLFSPLLLAKLLSSEGGLVEVCWQERELAFFFWIMVLCDVNLKIILFKELELGEIEPFCVFNVNEVAMVSAGQKGFRGARYYRSSPSPTP